MNLEEGKLVYVQKWDGDKETTLVRDIEDDKLVVVRLLRNSHPPITHIVWYLCNVKTFDNDFIDTYSYSISPQKLTYEDVVAVRRYRKA